MKKLRLFLTTMVLTLVFAASTFAGDMQCGVTSQTPVQPQAQTTSDASSEVTTTNEISAVDPLTELALSLIQSVLSLF